MLDQRVAPIYEALQKFNQKWVVRFDVKKDKGEHGNPELTQFLGQQVMNLDVNSMKPLDKLNHPSFVIKEAESLSAEAFGAKHAFFMVNGITSSVQAMFFAIIKRGDKIILPRNVHRSVLNALVLCGAYPIYINPEMNKKLVFFRNVDKVRQNSDYVTPEAKAIFVNNPTDYGIYSDFQSIVGLAYQAGMLALADEAHGTHLYFGEHLSQNAIASGCDMAARIMYKSGGSLTQSSIFVNQ